MKRATSRRYPIGAELIAPNQAHFRVWAPKAQDVDLVLEESAKKEAKRTFHPLEREDNGYFSGVANARAGALYRFRVNQAEHFHPHPASRFQPHGPHGSSYVVYSHFVPDGNYLAVYSDDYLIREHETDWGDSINFDGPNSAPVREFFITNGRYWIDEFYFDGFRFDATDAIHDKSDEYIIGAVGRAARTAAAPRSIILIAENERQGPKLIRPRNEGVDDLDAVWNDDFHHSAAVALTGRREAYYTDYLGTPQEFISAAKYGYLFHRQPYFWQFAPL